MFSRNSSLLIALGGIILVYFGEITGLKHYNGHRSAIEFISRGFILNNRKESTKRHETFLSNLASEDDKEERLNEGAENRIQESEVRDELEKLILEQCKALMKSNTTDSLKKYDWFENDEPMDSSDEEFANEYCETKVPDMDTIYKNLDPHGIRKYLPNKLTLADMSLGSVYGVGVPITEELEENKTYNSHAINTEIDDKKYTKDELGNGSVVNDDTHEFDFGEEFNDPNDESVVFEDELRRYFIKLPMVDWTNGESEAFNEALDRLDRCRKYCSQKNAEQFVSDIRAVFASAPCSDTGVTDSEIGPPSRDVALKPVSLYIEEYKHSDLLNDIDRYEKIKQFPIVEEMVRRDMDKPIFTLGGNIPDGPGEELVAPLVYIAIPKSSINEEDCMVINDSLIFRRNYTEKVGKVIDKIPTVQESRIGVILLPNEPGFDDQNIRYLADEISALSKSFVFVPDLADGKFMFRSTMNRLIKLIQLCYNVDRLIFVALGEQGRRIVDYTFNAMENTMAACKTPPISNESNEKDRLNCKKVLKSVNTTRLEDLLSRQSVAMLDDIVDGIRRIKERESLMAAKKVRDYNIVKPLSKLLQSIVLFDACNVNFEQVVQFGIPVLLLESNRSKVFENSLHLDDPKFVEKRQNAIERSRNENVNVFDFVNGDISRPLKKLIDENVTFSYLPSDTNKQHNVEQYRITSANTGVDIIMNIYMGATGHFYMKKPGCTREELKALGSSITDCATWITSWTY